MADQFTDSLLDFSRVQNSLTNETRSTVNQMLDFEDSEPVPIHANNLLAFEEAPAHSPPSTGHSQMGLTFTPPPTFIPPSILPSLFPLISRILEDLEKHPSRLLSLNPSRRDGITQYLDKLSGTTHPTLQSVHASRSDHRACQEPNNSLRRWIEGSRSTAQNAALKSYFEEVALITLGQAMVLKSWSDQGIRKWSATDLGRLNWALSTALRPYVPLDREGWQMTRPNLYSWYNPNESLQKEMWSTLEPWKLSDENPGYLAHILKTLRKGHSEVPEAHGFDARFYRALWNSMSGFGFNSNPETGVIKRNKTIFCPTLRDGELARTGPNTLQWIGLEASPFQFMICELLQVWRCPSPPPIWSIGTGLEVHTRDQLTFSMSSPKPSILCRIAELEACDSAFVLEEQVIRLQGRNANSQRFKEQIDGLTYFKRLKSAGTSLGDLQACVSLNKLRPGGLLWWAREESLSTKDGKELLNFFLERARLVSEWDFSEVEHTLPTSTPLFPQHLYLFQRDHHLESRLSHRPMRHSVHGQLRSHVELPLMLEDALQAAIQNLDINSSIGGQDSCSLQHSGAHAGVLGLYDSAQARGHWRIITHHSPTPQREWMDKWPDPTSQSVVRYLDQLRASSLPLANFTTIRPTPDSEGGTLHGTWTLQVQQRGFWVAAETDSDGRRLITRPLPQPGQKMQGAGLMILVSDEAWIAPLSAYLMTDLVHNWLDHHAERRGERWILNEQVIKWIPVPQELLHCIGIPVPSEHRTPLTETSPWKALAEDAATHPKKALATLSELERNIPGHCQIFVHVARALEYLRMSENRYLTLVRNDGSIKWGPLLEILPKGECVTLSLHPRIRLTGSLPSHLPIHKIDRVKTPLPGILLSTESGFTLHVGSDSSLLIHMIADQLDGVQHPTWSELLQAIQVPRRIELAESTAMDVMNSHAEQGIKMSELRELLQACQLFSL